MNIRIKFQKYGVMKFIGHLDMMRYFQKAIRRAGIDIAYSGGYSPHQIMSFAAPLGVGITSGGEYFDIAVNSTKSSRESIDALNAAMAEGVTILEYKKLPDTAKTSMSLVAAADYLIYMKPGYGPFFSSQEELQGKIQEFYKGQPEILITKQTKKSQIEMDLKQFIYRMEAVGMAGLSPKDAGNTTDSQEDAGNTVASQTDAGNTVASQEDAGNTVASQADAGNIAALPYLPACCQSEALENAKPLAVPPPEAAESCVPAPGALFLKGATGKGGCRHPWPSVSNALFLRVSTGSSNNIKPELVLETFCRFCSLEYHPFRFQIHRLEVYAASDEIPVKGEKEQKAYRGSLSQLKASYEKQGKPFPEFLPLGALGEDIL